MLWQSFIINYEVSFGDTLTLKAISAFWSLLGLGCDKSCFCFRVISRSKHTYLNEYVESYRDDEGCTDIFSSPNFHCITRHMRVRRIGTGTGISSCVTSRFSFSDSTTSLHRDTQCARVGSVLPITDPKFWDDEVVVVEVVQTAEYRERADVYVKGRCALALVR